MIKPWILRFVDAFAGDVFGDERENLHMRARAANLVFDVRFRESGIVDFARRTGQNIQ